MTDQIKQEEVNGILWRACDTFRGTIDATQYKDYILVMLFLRYVSDLWKDKREQYEGRYQGDAERVRRAMARERFVLPDGCDFDTLHSKRGEANIGELINIALETLEDANKTKLEGVFRNIDFNSEPNLGETKERNRRLKHLLEDFADPRLDLRPSRIGDQDVIGNAYEYLIGRFASDAGKKGGEFYTPAEVAILLAKLLDPQPGCTICDPAAGSGSLLIRVAKQVGSPDFSLFGMEVNGSTWALCRMNMFLHEMDTARIEWCNTLTSPKLVTDTGLMHFDIVVANPPFSLDKWGQDLAAKDMYRRFHRGLPPKSKGDYAFISHMIESAADGHGKVGVIVPHGVLFRGGAEGIIRQKLIEENLLEAVIGLPPNLFFGTGIPAAILIFNKGKATKDVLFIAASRDFGDGRNQNRLRAEDIDRIVATYQTFGSAHKYAYRATSEELCQNEFNCNVSRYVDTFEEEKEIDIVAVQNEIVELDAQLREVREQMNSMIAELAHG